MAFAVFFFFLFCPVVARLRPDHDVGDDDDEDDDRPDDVDELKLIAPRRGLL